MAGECSVRLRDGLHFASGWFVSLPANSFAGKEGNVWTEESYCWLVLRQGLVERVDIVEGLLAQQKPKRTWESRRYVERQELDQECFGL